MPQFSFGSGTDTTGFNAECVVALPMVPMVGKIYAIGINVITIQQFAPISLSMVSLIITSGQPRTQALSVNNDNNACVRSFYQW